MGNVTALRTARSAQNARGATAKCALVIGAACLSLVACASSPDSIAPAQISLAQYDGLTCKQIADQRAKVADDLASASAHQAAAHDSDTWGVLLIGLPVGSMGGGDHSAEIANLKGERAALDQMASKCGA